jgi:sulfur-oxidizing protein SoxB
VQVAASVAAITSGSGVSGRLFAAPSRQAISQNDLLRFTPKGQLTILHMADCHAQLMPLYFREPSVNVGVGQARGRPPHITDVDLLEAFAIAPGSHYAYALSSADFEALARTYGRVGGMDRMPTLIKAIRAERGADRTLLLDGGDALQGSYTALESKGADMVRVMEALGIEATTGHWEFTLGADRVLQLFGDKERAGSSKIAFLAGNIRENEFEEPIRRRCARRAASRWPLSVRHFPSRPSPTRAG